MREIKVETIGDLSVQHSVWAYCDACARSAELDLPALARRYGSALRVDALRRRVTCRQCGRRTTQIRISHGGYTEIAAPSNVRPIQR